MILFVDCPLETSFYLGEFVNQTILENLHYKYNFIIKQVDYFEPVFVEGYGNNIKLTYPEELDFSSKDYLTIRYIINNSSLAKNMKLNPDSFILDCIDLKEMKKCTVSPTHFGGKENGNYNTYHMNHYNAYSIYQDSSPINVILPKNRIELYIKDEDNKLINLGQNGLLYFVTNYTDNETNIFEENDIEEKTQFKTVIYEESKEKNEVNCRLWKPKNEKIRIFCKLKDNWNIQSNYINIKDIIIHYKNYLIAIIPSLNYIKINSINSSLSFLYSNEQYIIIDKDKDKEKTFQLKFNIWEYNNEPLILIDKKNINNYLIMDNCHIKGKEIICEILIEKIEEILIENDQRLSLTYYNYYISMPELDSVFDIVVNYTINNKETLYIEVKELLVNKVNKNNYFAYNTNITDISNIFFSKTIPLIFDTDSSSEQIICLCYMRKTTNNSLQIICMAFWEGTFSLSLNQGFIFNEHHVKYNFKITKISEKEKVTCSGQGNYILFTYPTILDFYSNDTLYLDFNLNAEDNTNRIKLNPESEELQCDNYYDENKQTTSKKCLVPKSHFNGKNEEYYYVQHLNYNNELIRNYEIIPIQVILPKENEFIIRIKDNTINIGQKGILSFMTDFDDNQNIFDSSDIEEKTAFKGTFTYDEAKYISNCYLWKPIGEKIRLICAFEESITKPYLKLEQYKFENIENILLLSPDYLKINQLSVNIAYLYSDKQEIKIEESKDEYSLMFKKGVYNNEKLMLYKADMGSQNIYLECKDETKEIQCTIKKNKILELLSYNGEIYSLAQLIDSYGVLSFNDILPITFKYENIAKKIVYLNITKLLTRRVDKNSFIIFETNITEIPILTTSYFDININTNTNANDIIKCLFKKSGEQNDDKLLFMCNAEPNKEYSLQITEDININNANILYDFKIAKSNDVYTISVLNDEGTKIISVNPEILDFTSQKTLKLIYQASNPEKLVGVKLNKDASSALECIDKIGIKECTIPESHFKEGGYYYTYHDNSLGEDITAYEIPKIKIIIPDYPSDNTDSTNKPDSTNNTDNKDSEGSQDNLIIIISSVIGGFVLIIIIFLIVRCIRKRNADMEVFSNKIDKILSDNPSIELQPELKLE